MPRLRQEERVLLGRGGWRKAWSTSIAMNCMNELDLALSLSYASRHKIIQFCPSFTYPSLSAGSVPRLVGQTDMSKSTEFVCPSSTRLLSLAPNGARRPDEFSQKVQNSSGCRHRPIVMIDAISIRYSWTGLDMDNDNGHEHGPRGG